MKELEQKHKGLQEPLNRASVDLLFFQDYYIAIYRQE